MVTACITAFLSSMATDIVMTKWVKAVALDEALRGAILSMMMAMLLLMGVNEALRNATAAYFWILGYGVGSYIAIKSNVKAKTNNYNRL